MCKRWFKIVAKWLLALVVVLALFLVCERWRGQRDLARYQRELRERGELLAVADFIEPDGGVDDGAAAAVVEAIERLKMGGHLPLIDTPGTRYFSVGTAITGGFIQSRFGPLEREDGLLWWIAERRRFQSEWVDNQAKSQGGAFDPNLYADRAGMKELRSALTNARFNNHQELSLGLHTSPSHLDSLPRLAKWFGCCSALELHNGRLHQAAEALQSEIALPHLLADGHVSDIEAMKTDLALIAAADTWEALQVEGWADADLLSLQTAWEKLDFVGGALRSVQYERVVVAATFDKMRASNEYTEKTFLENGGVADDWFADHVFAWIPAGSMFRAIYDDASPWVQPIRDFACRQIYWRAWRFSWLDQEQLRILKGLQRSLELCRDGVERKSFGVIKDGVSIYFSAAADPRVINRFRYPFYTHYINMSDGVVRAMSAEVLKSLAISAIAIKRYNLQHGKLPGSLEVLVPEFLPAVPVDFMDGKTLRYLLKPDGRFTLYSVGFDGVDDGGDTVKIREADGTVTRWDSRDVVWPLSVTVEAIVTESNERK